MYLSPVAASPTCPVYAGPSSGTAGFNRRPYGSYSRRSITVPALLLTATTDPSASVCKYSTVVAPNAGPASHSVSQAASCTMDFMTSTLMGQLRRESRALHQQFSGYGDQRSHQIGTASGRERVCR